MANETQPDARAATVDRAFEILALLRDSPEPLGVRAISRRVGTSPATAYRLLQTLAAHDFVAQAADSRAYRLGWAWLGYAASVLGRIDLIEVAGPLARQLRDETTETVTVQVPAGDDRVCVYEAEGLHEIRRRVGVGRQVPLVAGASGRAVLAFLPERDIQRMLDSAIPLTAQTLTDPAHLRRLLDETRRTGIAASRGETVDGVASVAAPIFDSANAIAGSIAVSGPSSRCGEEAMQSFIPALRRTALVLSRQLGYRGEPPWMLPAPSSRRTA